MGFRSRGNATSCDGLDNIIAVQQRPRARRAGPTAAVVCSTLDDPMSAIPQRLRIATRESRLALRQATLVADAIRARYPAIAIELVAMTTRGDRVQDRPLRQVGGKGLFVKELEIALEEDRADIAVHSLKDVPMEVPREFAIATFGAREEPFDAFVSNRHASL